MPVSLIHALALTKRAAAGVTRDLGLLAAKSQRDYRAADEVLAGRNMLMSFRWRFGRPGPVRIKQHE